MSDRLVMHDGMPPVLRRAYARGRRLVGDALRRRMVRARSVDPVMSRVRLPYEVMAYFCDAPVNLYQIRQWLYPLERLDEQHPVFILTRNNASFRALACETHLPIVNARRIALIDNIAQHRDIKMAVYVNQTAKNFHNMRYPDMLHVFLSHGESEKGTYMATNQAKAYDFVFVAGDAAVDRITSNLIMFQPEPRLRKIGRPQLDAPRLEGARSPGAPNRATARTTVLYAPTWEGDRPSMSYGSIQSHGHAIVEALTSGTRYRLVYRPHPRTGITLPEAGKAELALRTVVEAAAARDPGAGHRVDLTPDFGPQMAEADVMICDVSAVALDFLPTGKPLIVTVPTSPEAVFDRKTFLGSVYELPSEQASDVLALLDEWCADDVRAGERKHWVQYYYGDTTPGASMRRFLDASDDVIALRDRLVAEKRARLARNEEPSDLPPAEAGDEL